MEAILEQHTANIVSYIKKEYNISSSKEEDELVSKLPWIGIVVEEQCKGLRYNGGLYTQCTHICHDYCSTCQKNKYGSVYNRLKCGFGEYRDLKGRREVNYMSY